MKRLIPLILTLLLFLCACGKETETIWVLTQRVEIYYAEDGSVSGTASQLYEYDNRGNNTVMRKFYDGEPAFVFRYSYDRRGNQTRELVLENSGMLPDLFSRQEMKYDKNGNLTLHISYSGWQEQERKVYSYDESGLLIRLETITESGYSRVEEYTYEETGNQRITTTGDSMGFVDKEISYYDDRGLQYRKEKYRDDILGLFIEYTYDDQGRLSSFVEYDGAGTAMNIWEYHYDEEANTITTIYFTDAYSIDYYDDQGRRICNEFYDSDGTLSSRSTYTYAEITIPIQ